jgi:hypothetical protein
MPSLFPPLTGFRVDVLPCWATTDADLVKLGWKLSSQYFLLMYAVTHRKFGVDTRLSFMDAREWCEISGWAQNLLGGIGQVARVDNIALLDEHGVDEGSYNTCQPR